MYEQIYDIKNIFLAVKKAMKNKKSKNDVACFWFNYEKEVFRIHELLKDQKYIFGKYREFQINDKGVKRKISAAPFADRVVHHALMNILEPIFEKSFINDTYANRKGKGVFAALRRAKYYSNKFDFVLKIDIKKYFPSIDHEILKSMICRKIECERTFKLICSVIDSSNKQESVEHYFLGDNLFTIHERKKGLPLGNLTSQYFGNIYLGKLDHYAKEVLSIKGYIRYVDDILIYGNSLEVLEERLDKLEKCLSTLRLKVHPLKIKYYTTQNGFEFLGHKVFKNRFVTTSKNIRYIRTNIHHAVQSYNLYNATLRYAKNKMFASLGFLSQGANQKVTEQLLAKSVFCKPSLEVVSQPWWELEQQCRQYSLSESEQQYSRQQKQQPRFSTPQYCLCQNL